MKMMHGVTVPLVLLATLAACGGREGETGREGNPDDTMAVATVSPSAPDTAGMAGDTTRAPGQAAAGAMTVGFEGIGPLRVGMTPDQAKAALGGDFQPLGTSAGTEPGGCRYARSGALPAGVRVMLEGDRVVRVEVDSGTAAATAEGARIGDTESRVKQLYPGVQVQPHKYTDGHYLVVTPSAPADSAKRIVFETDGQKVLRFRAGQRPQVEYVEGCS